MNSTHKTIAAWIGMLVVCLTFWIGIAVIVVDLADAHPGVRSGSTAYCLRGTMADGSYTRNGSVANNQYRLGTKLTISPSPTGRRFFVVRDRIGYGSQLDFWVPSCGQARQWGRRSVTVRVGWHHSK